MLALTCTDAREAEFEGLIRQNAILELISK
jgi:hypothetical protein